MYKWTHSWKTNYTSETIQLMKNRGKWKWMQKMYSTNYRYFDKRELTPLGLPEATDSCFLFQFYHFSPFKITIKLGWRWKGGKWSAVESGLWNGPSPKSLETPSGYNQAALREASKWHPMYNYYSSKTYINRENGRYIITIIKIYIKSPYNSTPVKVNWW